MSQGGRNRPTAPTCRVKKHTGTSVTFRIGNYPQHELKQLWWERSSPSWGGVVPPGERVLGGGGPWLVRVTPLPPPLRTPPLLPPSNAGLTTASSDVPSLHFTSLHFVSLRYITQFHFTSQGHFDCTVIFCSSHADRVGGFEGSENCLGWSLRVYWVPKRVILFVS